MAMLRLVAGASLLLPAAFASQGGAAPGCGCELLSDCCKHGVFRSQHCWPNCALRAPTGVFDAPVGISPRSYKLAYNQVGSTTLSPTCSLLYLIPGAFDEGGLCDSNQNATVCEAVSSDPNASRRLEDGRSTLSVFAEPGTCEELEAEVCWESKGSNSYYWYSFDWSQELVESKWCEGWDSFEVTKFPAVAWSVALVPQGLQVSARWVNNSNFDACTGGYSSGVQEIIAADGWMNGSMGSPRWRCFDVRNDTSSHAVGPTIASRVVVYSTGDLYRPSNRPIVSGDGSQAAGLAFWAIVACAAVASRELL